ncbi:MAG TPA: glycosyltransferase [Saprospiraceae bacterium]|nr:glycosyltransferase [Saprospiraceae bacterium]HMQ83906.1 glycosyltransferase [Saprospiraceae bacterium]
MKLGFHYHLPGYKDESGHIRTAAAIGLFIDSLAAHVDELHCFMYSPVGKEHQWIDYSIRHTNVQLIDVGPHVRLSQRLTNGPKVRKIIAQHADDFDLLLLRAPTTYLSHFVKVLGPERIVPYLVGSYQEDIPLLKAKGIRRWLTIQWIKNYEKLQRQVARQAPLTLTNGIPLFEAYQGIAPRIALIKSTTLSEADFFTRNDTCLSAPFKALYTGRLVPSKGLDDILEVCAELKQEGLPIQFHIAGFTMKDYPDYVDKLQEKARQLDFEKDFVHHGQKKVGEELNALYRSCDMYVLASKGDFEGFPRTLWEAMANSLPIVAARVSSIPHFLTDGESALLFPTNDKVALKEKIKAMTQNQALRQKLIAHGRELAKDNTLESQGKQLVDLLKEISSAKA